MALQQRLTIFNWKDERVYHEKDIIKLLTSKKPKDKQKLNNMIEGLAEADDKAPLQDLLNIGYKIRPINSSGATFLHVAFYAESSAILSTGIKHWVPHITKDVVKIADSNGLTILHVACCALFTKELIEKCLEYDADVNAVFRSDMYGRRGFTPLHFAAANLDGSIWMKLIIDRNADVNAKDSRGRTPLHIACRIIEEPVKKVPGIYVEKVKILLDADADVNAQDASGNTPLMSLFPNHYDTFPTTDFEISGVPDEQTMSKFQFLLERGADVMSSNRLGDTIFHRIIKNLEYLRNPSYSFHKTSINFRDDDHAEMIRSILAARPDANVNWFNLDAKTPLQLAIFFLSAEIVRVLVSHKNEILRENFELHFDCLMSHCIVDKMPQLEEVVNFFEILELFVHEGFEIDYEQTLKVLIYLVHENCDGYFEINNEDTILINLLDILNFGSSLQFEKVYKKLMNEFNLAVNNLKFRKYAHFYIDSTLPRELISSGKLNDPIKVEMIAKIELELKRMKATKMIGSVTLYDVMTKHPRTIYQYLTDVKLSSVAKNYSIYKDIIRGHLTKALVRHYVEKSVFDYLKDLLPPSCPSLCCKIIMDYLTNEDALNVCRAVVEEC